MTDTRFRKRARTAAAHAAVLGASLFVAAPARAASLQKVDSWGASGVPATASMYIYVPDKLAAKPPILVLAHFCSGTASAVFGQAQGGGLIKAADQYGFIVVVPQTSNNCWDVGSTKSLTHDGGGDTQAIAEMVKYTITKYQANADRVYATGDSSGGMMTQALMAVYPDVFKGGSAFAGVPAGCWSVGDPDGSWSDACAGGTVTHTAQEWGDMARAMDPSYMGSRPRVQLFHGDADQTINYNNFKEAIKQWTNVLGLSTDPTTTTTVTLGMHQATREQWQNACGYVVLDAFTSMGGDHGPSDALFEAQYVVPFLALDQTDATDPEIAQCGAGGMTGAAGAAGATSAGGATGQGGAGAGGATGTSGRGGTTSGAGTTGLGGGGRAGSGGTMSSAGTTATGGGTVSSAGAGVGTGGTGGTGAPSGGSGASGGTPSNHGGSGTITNGGNGAQGGESEAGSGSGSKETSGCGCKTSDRGSSPAHALLLALGVASAAKRRRTRRAAAR
ncbi:MAG TPA: PHB depolymerase family esterase [Polyangiaceae bacterium]|nr:PHB depolymerase family esterase [Polyangiaceae bacterium]